MMDSERPLIHAEDALTFKEVAQRMETHSHWMQVSAGYDVT